MGVYVHFPWCARKCPYCDFASVVPPRTPEGPLQIDHEGYADALSSELFARAATLPSYRLQTVYVGGGTPSLWEPAALGRSLAAILSAFPRHDPDIEITVECNPSSLDRDRVDQLVAQGVNRLSIGVQSLDASRLRFLERIHDPFSATQAVKTALAAGVRVSADVIFAVATERGPTSVADAAAEASAVAALGVGHVSAYSLTIEPDTAFGLRARQGRLPLLDESAAASTFSAVATALADGGLARYEVSSFARPGEQSRHNLGTWRGQDYLGLGCAAVGTISQPDGSALRYRNPTEPERYLATVGRGRLDASELERLDADTRMSERIMLGLRTAEGVDLEAAAAALGVAAWPRARRRAVDAEVARGRLSAAGGRLRLTEAGWLFVDGIAASLM